MPDEARSIVPAETRDIATMPIGEAIELYAPNFAAVLPPNVPLDHFKRMVMTAISVNPDLIQADRRTFFNSCVKCASDGLLPDGREAALVIYKTKVKNRQGGETWIEAVQYLPMIAGIRKRLRNSGEVDSATAEVVYRKDRFKYRKGDDAFIEHEPPALDEDRGDAIGAYAIIKLASGEVIREVLTLKDIEQARAVSRAKDSQAGPWVKWWSEMARKTALRRAAKAAPQSAVLEKLLGRDDELPDHPPAALIEPPPLRPQRGDFVEHQSEPEEKPFFFTDEDGEIHEFEEPMGASINFLDALNSAAKSRGEDGVSAMRENGAHLFQALRDAGRSDLADRLSADCGHLLNVARAEAAEFARAHAEAIEAERQRREQRGEDAKRTATAEKAVAARPLRRGEASDTATEAPQALPLDRQSGDHVARPTETSTNSPAAQPARKDDTNGLGGPAAAGEPANEQTLALIKRGDEAASRGADALKSWWENGLSALQRGSLGARGRGVGPYLEAWKIEAAAVDAARQTNPERAAVVDPEPKPAEAHIEAVDAAGSSSETNARQSAPAAAQPTGPVRQEIRANSEQAGGVGESPAAAAQAAPSAPSGDLLGDTDPRVPRHAPEPAAVASPDQAERPSLAIAPVLKNGREDWRTWCIALFMPMLRKFNDDAADLAYFLGDNEDNITKAKAAGFKDEIEEAVAAQFKVAAGNG